MVKEPINYKLNLNFKNVKMVKKMILKSKEHGKMARKMSGLFRSASLPISTIRMKRMNVSKDMLGQSYPLLAPSHCNISKIAQVKYCGCLCPRLISENLPCILAFNPHSSMSIMPI